ncbi:MAG: 3-phosphoserine/phosphohydroxythreonine transaminase [Acidimicrobiia bacterium]|nr:3-phosphoserine/phosphohydroxythreonine transaminase [Acidimicrobiia bacterium]MDH5292753.1 3-phosphoserine/phosphohydroxythreonine transaminase [Acidimicrobiia bacterium]
MRVHNFGAGPCTLPADVLEEARDEMLDFAGAGMSVVEMSHRSDEYDAVHAETLRLTRTVSGCPDDFDILFVQGGATLQFGMIPMNLAGADPVGYLVTGAWGKGAFEDAALVANAYPAWDGSSEGFRRMPDPGEIEIRDATRYLHITTNETIGGIRMVEFPDVGVPLVGDMSSEYLARPIDWDRYDLVYGGVQKNLAPAGMAVVFIRREVTERTPQTLPKYLRYDWHAKTDSLGNTPPMFPIYIMGKVLARIEAGGGVEALEAASARKAGLIYDVIDESGGFYTNPVAPDCRSHMNVVFTLGTLDLESRFLSGAEERRMIGLKGHRSVGGCRASLYAALSEESAAALAAYMREFAADNRDS